MSSRFNFSLPLELCTEFLAYCSVRDVWSWACTSKYGQSVAQQALRARYRQVVAPFVQAAQFRRIMVASEAVISGSAALHFLEGRSGWVPNDMDVYVPFHFFESMVEYFVVQEGYEGVMPFPVIGPDDDDDDTDNLARILGLSTCVEEQASGAKVGEDENEVINEIAEEQVEDVEEDAENGDDDADMEITDEEDQGEDEDDDEDDGDEDEDDDAEDEGYGRLAGAARIVRLRRGDTRVDIICSKTDAALHPISYFWGTAVMNYLGADRVGCAYPLLTFQHKCLVTPVARIDGAPASKRVERCIGKYEERGYVVHMSRYALDGKERASTAIAVERSFEDEMGFSLDFGGDGPWKVKSGSTVSAQWEVRWFLGGHLGPLEYSPVSSTVARQIDKD